MPNKIMANYGPIIAHLLPRKDHSRAPFSPLFGRIIAMWHWDVEIHHHCLFGCRCQLFVNADMDDASHKRDKFMAKKLDINNDGMISLEELTSRQDKQFQILDLNADGMIDNTEFNGRIVAMFEKMDSNGDGSLDDKETRKMKRHNYGKM
ncbi:hypothetical protein N9X90_01575 [Alphaproteobacteria bacterium]|jgi:hypothetical protein|nr:hypothetical protein [Alphaproteobacteria bacterium]